MMPKAVRVNASSSCRAITSTIISGLYGTPTRPAIATTMRPCIPATVAPPRHLPITIEPRRIGATSISRRKPNSRSHTIDAAENIGVNITDIPRMPG